MGKINRGDTTKLSIRLSTAAKQNIEITANNLGISKGGVLLFELTKLLQNPPSKSKIQELEKEITLERNHFVVTVNRPLIEKINDMAEDYGMKKNVLIGYITSEHFENLTDPRQENVEPKKLMVQVNEALKKKMMDYSEKHYIPLNSLVSYSILQGPYDGLPSYDDGETVQFFTSVPEYIGEIVKNKAVEHNIREHFYTSLCIFKQFMTPTGRFYE